MVSTIVATLVYNGLNRMSQQTLYTMVSTTSLNNSLNCRAGSEDHVTMSSSKTVNIQLNNSAPPPVRTSSSPSVPCARSSRTSSRTWWQSRRHRVGTFVNTSFCILTGLVRLALLPTAYVNRSHSAVTERTAAPPQFVSVAESRLPNELCSGVFVLVTSVMLPSGL